MKETKSGALYAQTKAEKLKVTSDGLEYTVVTKDFFAFWQLVRTTKSKCYMLCVNGRNKKRLNDIVAFLLEENMLTHVFSGTDSSRLFTSSNNLIPLQKKIAHNFEGLKFILVRLNRAGLPKQKYC